ncbi:MAG: 5'-nucleotidase C-terminal domain-containing protein [Rhabdochlamydiaceae bacterium]|nr:5'-nucleotidase C-terminal domain-containing protein [Rhabdochlamydiaceae bacterium]
MKRWIFMGMFALGVQNAICAKTATFTILSFNDVYEIVADPRGRGGFAEMMTLLEEERKKSEYSITTVNGDFLSPCILSVFDKGAHRIDLFNQMGVDVVSVGNHEFDFGPAEMLKRVQESRFPWLAANALGLDGDPFTGSQQTMIFDVDGIKVGMFGLITVETPELSSTEKKVCFSPLVYTSERMIKELKEQGAEVIVALTHLLMAEDRQLAAEVPDIHVILGGHDHDPITWYDDHTFIHKSGQNAYYLVRLDLILEKDDKTGHVDVFPSWNVILNKGKARHPEVAATVDNLQLHLRTITEDPIGEMGMRCNSLYTNVRSKETEIGNLMADALRVSCGADLAILTGGTIRGGRFYEPGQSISLKDLLIELPFGSINVMVQVSGKAILEALENGVSQVEGKAGRFPQVSGMQFAYDITQPPGNRVRSVFVQGEPLDLRKNYRVATINYMFNGGDGYSMFKEGKVLLSPLKQISLVDTVSDYIKTMAVIQSPIDGRIRVLGDQKNLDSTNFDH